MFDRLKKLFRRQPEPDSVEWIPVPDVDATPDDAESDAELPPEIIRALKQWPATAQLSEVVSASTARFRVQRVHDGTTYQAYAGASGGDARRAWEAYQASELSGLFVFMDGDDCRGTFTR